MPILLSSHSHRVQLYAIHLLSWLSFNEQHNNGVVAASSSLPSSSSSPSQPHSDLLLQLVQRCQGKAHRRRRNQEMNGTAADEMDLAQVSPGSAAVDAAAVPLDSRLSSLFRESAWPLQLLARIYPADSKIARVLLAAVRSASAV